MYTQKQKDRKTTEIRSPPDIILYKRLKGYCLRLGNLKVNIPFVCQSCGRCCSQIGFPVGEAKLKKIADYLKISLKDLRLYFEDEDEDGKTKIDYDLLSICPFLKDNLCSIYPVRPEGCRLFPFTLDFKDYGIGCEGLKRLRELEEFITEDFSDVISRSKSIEVGRVDSIATEVPQILVIKYLESNPSQVEKDLFFRLNKPQKSL